MLLIRICLIIRITLLFLISPALLFVIPNGYFIDPSALCMIKGFQYYP